MVIAVQGRRGDRKPYAHSGAVCRGVVGSEGQVGDVVACVVSKVLFHRRPCSGAIRRTKFFAAGARASERLCRLQHAKDGS